MVRARTLLPVAVSTVFIFSGICIGEGIVIRQGGSITITGSDVLLDMNCHDILIESGGSLIVQEGSSLITNTKNIQIDSGGSIQGGGTINLTGTWLNNGDYTLDPSLNISFQNGCSVFRDCRGIGDTDGDGLSDYLEGMRDRNDDSVYDFLDSNTQSYICDINNDNSLDLADIIWGLRITSGVTQSGFGVDMDINHDGKIGMAEVQCVFLML